MASSPYSGELSVYTTAALRRQLERDGLTDLVGELVVANGVLDEAEVERLPPNGDDGPRPRQARCGHALNAPDARSAT